MGNRLSKIYTRTGDDGDLLMPIPALPARASARAAKGAAFAALRRPHECGRDYASLHRESCRRG
jgi:hypothetical protein